MMSNWNPKPKRPQDPNPLFKMDEREEYVVKGLTPIERQRRADGTPHTTGNRTRLVPAESFYLEAEKLDKSQPPAPKKPSLDPDAVVKSFLEKSRSGSAVEEED